MIETKADVLHALEESVVLKATFDGRLIGSVRGRIDESGACYIGRLSVDPAWQNHGLGARLMREAEGAFPSAHVFTLITGETSPSVRLYERLGYRVTRREPKTPLLTVVTMEKETEAGANPRGET
jgi:ribosomal protein S18 acetylase RimI-like enzyme